MVRFSSPLALKTQNFSWCYLCHHWWHRRWSWWQQPVAPMTTKLTSRLIINDVMVSLFGRQCMISKAQTFFSKYSQFYNFLPSIQWCLFWIQSCTGRLCFVWNTVQCIPVTRLSCSPEYIRHIITRWLNKAWFSIYTSWSVFVQNLVCRQVGTWDITRHN